MHTHIHKNILENTYANMKTMGIARERVATYYFAGASLPQRAGGVRLATME